MDTFIDVMNNFNLAEIKDLQFIHEFPVVSEALKEEFGLHYAKVIDDIKKNLN